MVYLACWIIAGFTLFVLTRLIKNKRTALLLKNGKRAEQINLFKAEFAGNRGIVSALRNKIYRYTSLKEITESLVRSLSLGSAVDVLIDGICALFSQPKDKVRLCLWDSRVARLSLFDLSANKYRRGDEGEAPVAAYGDVFDVWVFKHQVPLLVEDSGKDFRFDIDRPSFSPAADSIPPSLISAPLVVGKRVIGILRLDGSRANAFSWDDLRFLSVISDLAALSIDNARLYEHTQRLAITDGLTGLYLRQYFMVCLNERLRRGADKGERFCLLILDIDYFKRYNDRFGHICGDIVLKRIAALLQEECGGKDALLSRYGGEEFAVLLPHSGAEQGAEIAEAIRQRIAREKVVLRRAETSVTVSLGVSVFPRDGLFADVLLHKADSGLYKAKQRGRDRVCFG